jgi:hypothetical protein
LRTRRGSSHAGARSGGAGGGGGAPRAEGVARAPMDGSAPLTLARRRRDAQRSALKASKVFTSKSFRADNLSRERQPPSAGVESAERALCVCVCAVAFSGC